MEPISTYFTGAAIWSGICAVGGTLAGEIAGGRADQWLGYSYEQLRGRLEQYRLEANNDLDRAVYRAYWQASAQCLIYRYGALGYDSAAVIKHELLPHWATAAVRRLRPVPYLGLFSETERQWLEAALEKFSRLLQAAQAPDFCADSETQKALAEARARYVLLFRPAEGEAEAQALREPLIENVIAVLGELQPDLPDGVAAVVREHWFQLFCGCFQGLFKSDGNVQAIVLGKLLAGLVVRSEAGQAVALDAEAVSRALLARMDEPLRNLLDEQTAEIKGAIAASESRVIAAVQAMQPDGGRVTPPDLPAYFRACCDEWMRRGRELDRRFVRLTLEFEYYNERVGYEMRPDPQERTYHDLGELLAARPEFPVLLVWGDPGCGKSTLLRHLQLTHSKARLADGGEEISFYISLNTYHGEHQTPRQWLRDKWAQRYRQLPPLETFLREGRVLLLLDALNEMKPVERRVAMFEDWRALAEDLARQRNRLVFTCRENDYRVDLSCDDYVVPRVLAQPMTPAQMNEFVEVYAPAYAAQIEAELDSDANLQRFYRNPYFLTLLCEVVNQQQGAFPKGRATLFTRYVRSLLKREYDKQSAWLTQNKLLHQTDQDMLIKGYGKAEFALPERGLLLSQLRALAFSMQRDGGEVSFDYDRTLAALADEEHADAVLDAAVALNLLDKTDDHQFKFFHQQLQEYFAARQFARAPEPALVTAVWEAETFAAEIAALPPGAALPAIEQSHWVETAVIAVPMANDPAALVRALMPSNLPLAARCAQSEEWHADEPLKDELREALVKLSQHWQADVRVRIAAGEQLGWLGDPRFTRHEGTYGPYLIPRFRDIAGGMYPIGTNDSGNDDERFDCYIEIAPFEMAEFPVTNAEYALFIEAGGYQQEQWWDTSAAKRWLLDDGGEGEKAMWRNARQRLRDSWSDERIRAESPHRWSLKDAEWYIALRNLPEKEFETWLSQKCTRGKPHTEPAYWDSPRFNNPGQPVMGVTWYEARAYANWLTANVADGRVFRLPTEAEFEAAARGQQGRLFSYGNKPDATRSNTVESRIRHTTPIGIFDNATPEGVYDLSGNVWTWTLSLGLNSPPDPDDGLENIEAEGNRTLRGGSWDDFTAATQTSHRNPVHPAVGNNDFSFRLICHRLPR